LRANGYRGQIRLRRWQWPTGARLEAAAQLRTAALPSRSSATAVVVAFVEPVGVIGQRPAGRAAGVPSYQSQGQRHARPGLVGVNSRVWAAQRSLMEPDRVDAARRDRRRIAAALAARSDGWRVDLAFHARIR